MNVEESLMMRSGSACELCGSKEALKVYDVPPLSGGAVRGIVVCSMCHEQITEVKPLDVHHWRCLNNAMWSTVPAVQVVVWRLLNKLRHEGWPQDLLDMMYLDDETAAWAKEVTDEAGGVDDVISEHKDSNGSVLRAGDTVTLIKDLEVKGAGFTAKRGTPVRSIVLVEDNPGQIEGRVNGQKIVILTQFVKKS